MVFIHLAIWVIVTACSCAIQFPTLEIYGRSLFNNVYAYTWITNSWKWHWCLLQPLIEELKELWQVGFATYDAFSKQYFQMHAAVLWTINDFSAYANLSGWSTKGKLAYASETSSLWLKNGKKFCYMGHCRFLPIYHRLRRDCNFSWSA